VPDGRYFGYIQAIETASRPAEISFDVAEFLSGDAANAAAEADGAIEEGKACPTTTSSETP